MHIENGRLIQPLKVNQPSTSGKEDELSQDEEEKFYKKVFKTSLN
ncbi:MAG: hypothetical protein WA014_01165 [Minisyncoccia bacterium]